jgi:uncharacterized protein (TIGR02246 family)
MVSSLTGGLAMKKFALVALSTILVAAAAKSASSADPAKEADEKAIRSILARLAEDWNKHEMKSFSTQFADDVEVVNRFGQYFRGRAKVEEHLVGLHASPFRDHLVGRSSEVESLRFITPDVALVHERAKEETGESIRTYVLSKKDGRWKVESSTINAIGNPGQGPSPSR